ncbi:MAG: glycosyltransferase, partial [Desulfatiglandales bacterium]
PNMIKIEELKREISPWNDLKAFVRICLLILKLNPHILHTHMSKAGSLGRLGGLLFKALGRDIKLVHTFHGHIFEGYFSENKARLFLWVERFLGRRTDSLIAITRTQKQELCQEYRIAPSQRFRVIPLGFDLRRFLGLQKRTGEGVLIGIVGRLVPIKNHELFLQAAKLIIDERDDVKFWVVGDGERKGELQELSRALGIEKRVLFKGWIRSMEEVYSEMDVLVMSSLNEGTPVTIIEAMASNVAVVSTDVGGVRDILGERIQYIVDQRVSLCERGILCHSFSPEDLFLGIKFLLEMPIQKRDKMIHAAKEFVVEHYDRERLLDDIVVLYRELLGG